jgi:hypothetical protein
MPSLRGASQMGIERSLRHRESKQKQRRTWKPGELPIHTNKSQCVELRMQSSSHASYVGVRSTSVALWIRKVTRASLDGTLFTCFTNWGGNWGIPEAAAD